MGPKERDKRVLVLFWREAVDVLRDRESGKLARKLQLLKRMHRYYIGEGLLSRKLPRLGPMDLSDVVRMKSSVLVLKHSLNTFHYRD